MDNIDSGVIYIIVAIQVIALITLIALLVAMLRCIYLIDKNIKQKQGVLFNPVKPIKGVYTNTPVYPMPKLVKKETKEDLNVSGYKTQAEANEEKAKVNTPDIDELLPTQDDV